MYIHTNKQTNRCTHITIHSVDPEFSQCDNGMWNKS